MGVCPLWGDISNPLRQSQSLGLTPRAHLKCLALVWGFVAPLTPLAVSTPAQPAPVAGPWTFTPACHGGVDTHTNTQSPPFPQSSQWSYFPLSTPTPIPLFPSLSPPPEGCQATGKYFTHNLTHVLCLRGLSGCPCFHHGVWRS